MAPTGHRRSGHSRRAQYNLFTGYMIAAAGALVGAILLGLSLWHSGLFGGLRGEVQDSARPIGEAVATARVETVDLFATIGGYLRAGSQNAELSRKLELARIRLAEAEAVKQENSRLKALLKLKEHTSSPVAVARLVGSSASSTRRFAYIGAGSDDGVRIGMPVRSPKGIVGRILGTGDNSSRILLLTDSESIIPVRRAKDEIVAFAQGRSDGILRIRLINLGINPLEPGDLFVTSGAGGYYPPGIAVAIVNEVTDDGALARMVSSPAATDYVAILPVFEPEATAASQVPAEQEFGD